MTKAADLKVKSLSKKSKKSLNTYSESNELYASLMILADEAAERGETHAQWCFHESQISFKCASELRELFEADGFEVGIYPKSHVFIRWSD